MAVATPRNTKRALTPFSTPAHKGETPKAKGKVFGRRLGELTQRVVTVPNLEADLMVPKFVASACSFIEERKGVESREMNEGVAGGERGEGQDRRQGMGREWRGKKGRRREGEGKGAGGGERGVGTMTQGGWGGKRGRRGDGDGRMN